MLAKTNFTVRKLKKNTSVITVSFLVKNKIFGKKNFWEKKIFGKKKFNLKKKIFGNKKFLVKKNFW